VLVPHGELETAKYVGGQITIKHPSGIERVQIPIEYHNLEQYFRDIRKNRKLIDAMKSRNEYFGFRFFGNNSSEFFSDIDLLLERLESYRDVNAGMKSRRKGAEIYRNIEILRLNSKAMRNWETPSMKTRGKTKKQNRASAKRWREAHPDKARKGTRERVAKWRASMTATEKKSMLKKQRIYAKKWRKNNK
jgi:hypothetical protein